MGIQGLEVGIVSEKMLNLYINEALINRAKCFRKLVEKVQGPEKQAELNAKAEADEKRLHRYNSI